MRIVSHFSYIDTIFKIKCQKIEDFLKKKKKKKKKLNINVLKITVKKA
ncbi:hypothetical protein HanPI659440_Chr17g0670021 [Helianthus annuus]|nr:hypothetical protein HanPI659440_Chr17g0670021 [Helianthus annuus]